MDKELDRTFDTSSALEISSGPDGAECVPAKATRLRNLEIGRFHRQHAHWYDIQEPGGACHVDLAAGTGVALAEANDLRDDVLSLSRDHDERSEPGHVVYVVEAHNQKAVGTAVHLDDELIRRGSDYRSDGPAAIVRCHC